MLTRGKSRKIHTIIYQMAVPDSSEVLCAQVLEFHIGAQARTLPELYRRLERAIVGHVAVRRAHGMEPFADLPSVPGRYREWYELSKVLLPPQVIRVPLGKKTIPLESKVAAHREESVAVGG